MKITGLIFLLTLLSATALPQLQKAKQADDSKPFVLGVIDEISSNELVEKRTLNIYLPDGYSKNDTARYPVVYLLDGGADEDFIHVAGIYQFNSFPWIDRVPRSIVVGVSNVDRQRDFTFPTHIEADKKKYKTSGHSEKFIAFIEKELQPFIQKKYHAAEVKTIIGQSLAGLLAAEILLKKPLLFDKYIIISPSLWWDNGSLLTQAAAISKNTSLPNTQVYIGVGKEGLSPGDIPHVGEVDANLLAEKLISLNNKNVIVSFDYLPQEDHATVSHQAIFNALRILFPKQNGNK